MRPVPLVCWVLGLVAVVWLLSAWGRGALAPPPLDDPRALGTWYGTRSGPEVLFAGLRLVVIAAAWYLLATIALGILARLSRAARLVALSDVLTVPPARRMMHGAFGMGLAAFTVTSLPTPEARALERADVVALDVDEAVLGDDSRAGAVAHRLPFEAPEHLPGLEVLAAPDGEDAVVGEPEAGTGPAEETTYTVQPGDHLWSIAEQALATDGPGTPSEADITGYWLAVIEENRNELVDPGNADLLYPGQEIVLPELPGR